MAGNSCTLAVKAGKEGLVLMVYLMGFRAEESGLAANYFPAINGYSRSPCPLAIAKIPLFPGVEVTSPLDLSNGVDGN
jgi:hypothetical protein